jgi:hypothetical protein
LVFLAFFCFARFGLSYLLAVLRKYREALAEDAMLMDTLRGVVRARDWIEMTS